MAQKLPFPDRVKRTNDPRWIMWFQRLIDKIRDVEEGSIFGDWLGSLNVQTAGTNRLPYATAADTAAFTDFTAQARTFLAAATKAAQRQAIDLPGTLTSGDVWYVDGGAVQRLAKGADGEVLRLAAGLPDWVSQTGIGSWEQIERATFSGSTSVSIGGAQTPSDYDMYRLVLYLTVSVDGATVDVWASDDGGSTKITDYSRAGTFVRSSGAGGDFGNTTDTSLPSNTIDTGATNKNWHQNIEVQNPGSSDHKFGWRHQAGPDDTSGTNLQGTTEHFWVEDTATLDSFIMEPSSGNMTGAWVLLGLKKTP